MARGQLSLPFGPIRNSELFSNHWLENRLPLEPEWTTLRPDAVAALRKLDDLWRIQRTRVAQYEKEAQLEQAFIQPALEALGWHFFSQPQLRGREPDYALFLDDAALAAGVATGQSSNDFWKHPIALADAKAWHIALDRPRIINQQREYPPEQIERYLDKAHVDYAILTNGGLWRLIPRNHDPGQPRFGTWLECNLRKLLDDRAGHQSDLPELWQGWPDFLRFYMFFSPAGLRPTPAAEPLVQRARTGSSRYRVGVGESLKDRVFDALGYCMQGFLEHKPNNLAPARDLEACRRQSLVLLYRLLFVLFAEDRGLLPYGKNRAYTENRSLGRFRDDIAARLDRIANQREADYAPDQVTLWPDLLLLFDLIDTGKSSYQVQAYNGGLFDPDQHPFLKTNAIPDWYVARVIDQLGRAIDPTHPEAELCRVDYRDLAIQHLGDVYEGLLELVPHIPERDMILVRSRAGGKKEERVVPTAEPLAKGFEYAGHDYPAGLVYLVTDKGERRASGSYYTPNHIVDPIVEKTLGPLCERISQQLQVEIAEAEQAHKAARGGNRDELDKRLATLRADFDDRILGLRVLDMAMGSGHFLLRACQYLAEQIATNPNAADPGAEKLKGDESILTYWKRRVVERCLYGVDRNEMAVELAKLALWLETVAVDQPLTFLDHHLRWGDSLIGATVAQLGTLPGSGELFANVFEQQIKGRLPSLLKAVESIRRIPSSTVAEVKAKQKLYEKTFEPVRRPFRDVAHVWTSHFFLEKADQPPLDKYKELLAALGAPAKFKAAIEAPPMQRALRAMGESGLVAFHWELEFPEVFFGDAGQRTDAGFDAVIGNPPYDVLSEKETGRSLAAFQGFIRAADVYKPSLVGKNNLYKLFICRALALLADGGRMGFITPMTILGDAQASGVRKAIFARGAFETIEAFPQEDDATRRVFPEAKMCTAIVVVLKTDSEAAKGQAVQCRRHPANVIDEHSVRLSLTTKDIGLYDPTNLTIPACSQDDWNLAMRIMASGRVGRISDFAQFFQGEVNETLARKAGFLTTADRGDLIIRGASLQRYVVGKASQGTDIFLDAAKFLRNARPDSKAFHHAYERVAVQRVASRSNLRRVTAAFVPAGKFLNDVNYAPTHLAKIDLHLLLALLNAKLSEWYFRLGSTNAHVGQYQIDNLPCPIFADGGSAKAADKRMEAEAMAVLRGRPLAEIPPILAPGLAAAPFSPAVREVIIAAAKQIIAIETQRGDIARTERSALAPAAQPYQDLIDRLFYAMAGLTEAESAGLEERLAGML